MRCDVNIFARSLLLTNGAGVSVSSSGEGNPGDLRVQAGNFTLDRGVFFAESASGNGGNITLQAQDLLLMRHNSQVSTTAGNNQNGSNGGDITINTPFIVAVPQEDSDITANAFTGKGGYIQITTSGIFGIQRQRHDTPISDITASSQPGVNGVVNINTPNVDPSRALVALPTKPVDITGLIAQSCPGGGGNVARGASEFIVTERGGIPPSPDDALGSDAVVVGLVPPARRAENRPSPAESKHSPTSTPDTIVEATGWAIGADGQVILIASAPNVTPQIPWLTSCCLSCALNILRVLERSQ